MVDLIVELVRPFVTVLFSVALVYFVAIKILPIEVFVPIASVAIVWWYKDREAAKMRKELENLKNNSVK